jgi:hypothetical protein
VIAHAFEPVPQGNQVRVRTEESGYDDNTSSIPMRDAEFVINR